MKRALYQLSYGPTNIGGATGTRTRNSCVWDM